MSGIHRETVDQLQLSMKIAQENEKWMINIEHVLTNLIGFQFLFILHSSFFTFKINESQK